MLNLQYDDWVLEMCGPILNNILSFGITGSEIPKFSNFKWLIKILFPY